MAATVLLLCTAGSMALAADESGIYPRKLDEIKTVARNLVSPKGSTKEEFLSRLKLYRFVAGIPYQDLQWDDSEASLAQHAAIICDRLGKLTHTPERPPGMSDADYTAAKAGAGQTNLFMGGTNPTQCVDWWMWDSNQGNIDRLGHRRWILNPAMGRSGFGASGRFAAMYAFDTSNREAGDWDFVAYPARGYMPSELFSASEAWNVSPNPSRYAMPSKDRVKVSIHRADAANKAVGEPLKIGYFNVEVMGFGSGPAVIFRPEAVSLVNAKYVVQVSGLQTSVGQPATIEYMVHFVYIGGIGARVPGASTPPRPVKRTRGQRR